MMVEFKLSRLAPQRLFKSSMSSMKTTMNLGSTEMRLRTTSRLMMLSLQSKR